MTNIPYADEAWNPTSGCSKVSLGCANCWAEAVSHRFSMTHLPWTPEHAAENVVTHPARLEEPLRWRKPRTVAVCFMGDWMHEAVPDEFVLRMYDVMLQTPQHTYLMLTKRPERMRHLFSLSPAAGHIWLGVTAENQRMADERIPLLLDTPSKHWVSAEPLLGPVDLHRALWGICPVHDGPSLMCNHGQCPSTTRLDGVVVGGESGPGHRPMDLQWAKDITDECTAARVPVYFKQKAANRPGQPSGVPMLDTAKALPWA